MEYWFHPLLRFTHYALLMGLFGLSAFRLIGLRMINFEDQSVTGKSIVTPAAAAAPLISLALMLSAIAAMMGQSVLELELATVEAMIMTTSLGGAFFVRFAVLTAALFILFMRRTSSTLVPVALLYGLALATLPWSGHAAASEGGIGLFHRLNDALHLLAAGLWIGAIGWFLVLTIAAHRRPATIKPSQLFSAMHRFATLGVVLVGVVAITGLINAQLTFGLSASVDVLATDYGQLLALKIALVGGMLLFAARNARTSRRAVVIDHAMGGSESATLASLRVSLAAELGLAVTITGLVALLGMLSPME